MLYKTSKFIFRNVNFRHVIKDCFQRTQRCSVFLKRGCSCSRPRALIIRRHGVSARNETRHSPTWLARSAPKASANSCHRIFPDTWVSAAARTGREFGRMNSVIRDVFRVSRLQCLSSRMPNDFTTENSKGIWFSTGEPLSCFDYRAWGEGEPSHSKGCVALANPSVKSSAPFWKVMPCHTSLPFICEISPLFQESSKQSHENHNTSRIIRSY